MKIKPAFLLIPAIALAILILLIFILSDTPARTLYFFFIGPFRNIYSFANMLNASVPLILGALGITVAMKTGHLNLGGEGQVYLGAFIATAVVLPLSLLGVFGALIAICAACVTSAAMSAFSGFCKARWNTSELITSFLLSCALIPIVNYLITGPFLDPDTSLISMKKIAENIRLPFIIEGTVLSSAIFVAMGAVVVVHIFLTKTVKGYELRMAGSNELFARYGGINTKLNTVLSMSISGGFYGFSGAIAVFGIHHTVIKEFSAGLGWGAIAVALIAGFNPLGVIPAAFFFTWISAGARSAMQNTGLSFEVAYIVQAVIFLLSTSMLIKNFFYRNTQKKGAVK